MRVQIDRYNPSTFVPADPGLAVLLLLLAIAAFLAALHFAGVRWRALAEPLLLFQKLIGSAGRRGEGVFWTVWCLISAGCVALAASVLVWALCVTTVAGDILNPPAPVKILTPPNVPLSSVDQSDDGRNGDETSDPTADSIMAAAMNLLDTVLALL